MPLALEEYVLGRIWLCSYPVKLPVVRFEARMTVIRLDDGTLMLHSPCEIDHHMRRALTELGDVAFIVAPGTLHHLHMRSAQAAFPHAKTFICPGLEVKRPDLHFDHLLGDDAPSAWAGQLEQVLIRSRWVSEVAFFQTQTRTLILVDLIENFTDATPHVDWKLKLLWKTGLHMWNKPKPAPEYQLGWSDKAATRAALHRILHWDFERVILAHGDIIEADARKVVEGAWRTPLAH